MHEQVKKDLRICFANVEGFDFEKAKELITLNNQLQQTIENFIANKEEDAKQIEN